MPAAQEMPVQMKNRLPRVGSYVGYDAIAAGQPFALGDIVGYAQAFGRRCHVLIALEIGQRFHMPVRDNQNMRGRPGMQVPKRGDLFILKNDFGWRTTCNDLTKNTWHTSIYYSPEGEYHPP